MHTEKTQRIVRDHRSPLVLGAFTVLIAAVVWGKGLDAAALGFAVFGVFVAGVRHVAWRATQGAGVCIGWTVFGVPLWRHCLGDRAIESVDLRIEKRGSGRARHRVYAVYLSARPRPRLRLWRPRNYLRARRYAEALARLFDAILTDDSTGRVVRRGVEELDLSLGDRLRQAGASPRYPELPQGGRLVFRDRGSRKVLTLASRPMPWWVYPLIFLLPLVPFAIFLSIGAYSLAVGTALMTLAFWWVGVHSLFPLHLEIDRYGIRYRLFILSRRIAWAELEELVMNGQTLYLLGDRKRLTVPYGFDDPAEAGFVEALLRYVAWERAGLD
jgi:hypothetical protein